MQHHPLGKASRKLHKSARDRVNKAIGAMLDGPNQKGKSKSYWTIRAHDEQRRQQPDPAAGEQDRRQQTARRAG